MSLPLPESSNERRLRVETGLSGDRRWRLRCLWGARCVGLGLVTGDDDSMLN